MLLAICGMGGESAAEDERWPVPFPVVQPELGPLDSTTLPRRLRRAGFVTPRAFKALVVEIQDDGEAIEYRAYDFNGTSLPRQDWWPASTVKIFAAVAALEKLHAAGFTPRAQLVFHYQDKPFETSVEELVRRALTPSHNPSFDRLVELVGFEELHDHFFDARHGLAGTVLLRSYGGRVRDKVTKRGSNRQSPAITIREGERTVELPQRHGQSERYCPNQGNCTSVLELAETMRRIMLHERLPEERRFALGQAEIDLLRSALSGVRKRGLGVVNGLRKGFGDRPLAVYHKPGYATGWFSDNVFIKALDTGEQWMVGMVGFGGREVLDEAAVVLGKVLAKGPLAGRPATPAPAAISPEPRPEKQPETPSGTDGGPPASPGK